MPPGMTPATYGLAQPQPQLFTKKVKLLIGGALLMVLAAIATIAIIKGSSGDKKTTSENSVAPAETKKETPKVAVTELPKDDKKLDLQKKLDEQASLEKAEAQKKLDEQKTAEAQKKLDEQKKVEAQKKLDEQKRVAEEQKKVADEQKRVEDQKRLEAKRADDQRKAEEAQRRAEERKAEQARKADEARERKLEAQRRADEAKKKKLEKKETSVAANTSTTKKSADTSEIKSKADTLYRARKFKDAGQVLRSAASSLGEADARELKSTAAAYEQVGAAYNVGMGQGTSPVDAYTNLTKALNLDRPFGVFTDEIKAKLGQVAPKAATKYMADKSYEQAFTAVRVAEGNGGGNSTTQAIRGALVDKANELYQEAMSLKDSDKDAARQKLQRIRGMVDGKTPVLVKAEKALRDLPR
jgi:chemotaxis protein histidine kinase CheA